MKVRAFFDTPTSSVSYVVWDEASKDAVVIDPILGYEPVGSKTNRAHLEQVLSYVRGNGLTVHYSLETHCHADHLSGGPVLREALGAAVAISEHVPVLQLGVKALLDLPESFATDGSQFDRLIADGETLMAGSLAVEAVPTPGHTPTCLTYRIGDALFVGDALFMDDYGTGRCDFEGGDAGQLFDSIQRLYALPDETRVFVGHDYQPGGREPRWETTVGKEKAYNPQLNGQTAREAFVTLRTARDATLATPRLLFPAIQVNANGGRLPEPSANGRRYFRVPVDPFGD